MGNRFPGDTMVSLEGRTIITKRGMDVLLNTYGLNMRNVTPSLTLRDVVTSLVALPFLFTGCVLVLIVHGALYNLVSFGHTLISIPSTLKTLVSKLGKNPGK
jgi:hypothetical protein